MKLYAKIINEHETRMSWIIEPFFHPREDEWYEIQREPDFANREYLEYNAGKDCIEIKQQKKTDDEIIEECRIKVNTEIQAKLPELMRIMANDDTKGFDELKAEIRTIDQSIKVVQQK